jgi:hypothetical protein
MRTGEPGAATFVPLSSTLCVRVANSGRTGMLPRRVDGAAVRAINTCQVMNSERHLFGPNEASRQAAAAISSPILNRAVVEECGAELKTKGKVAWDKWREAGVHSLADARLAYPESKSLHASSESSDLPVTLSLDVSLWLPQKALSLLERPEEHYTWDLADFLLVACCYQGRSVQPLYVATALPRCAVHGKGGRES